MHARTACDDDINIHSAKQEEQILTHALNRWIAEEKTGSRYYEDYQSCWDSGANVVNGYMDPVVHIFAKAWYGQRRTPPKIWIQSINKRIINSRIVFEFTFQHIFVQ